MDIGEPILDPERRPGAKREFTLAKDVTWFLCNTKTDHMYQCVCSSYHPLMPSPPIFHWATFASASVVVENTYGHR